MNYTRYLISAVLATMVFTIVFLAQQQTFQLLRGLQDPFEDARLFTSIPLVTTESFFVTDAGEIVGVNEGTQLSTEEQRLESGSLFVSGAVMNTYDVGAFLKNDSGLMRSTQSSFDPRLFGLDTGDLSKADLDLLFGRNETENVSVSNPSVSQPEINTFQDNQQEFDSRLFGLDTSGFSELDVDLLFNKSEGDTVSSQTLPQNKSNDTIVLKPGEIKVGPVVIQYPLASAYIVRDAEAGKSTVYAYGGTVNIWFDGAVRPFVLPSQHKVILYDRLFNAQTGKLFYTKLQKEFRMSSFEMFGVTSVDEGAQGAIVRGWEYQQAFINTASAYARSAHKKLVKNAFQFDGFLQGIHSLQKNYAIGYPERKLREKEFEDSVRTLFDVIESIPLNGLQASSLQSLHRLQGTIQESSWQNKIDESEELSDRWNSFAHAHQILARTASMTEPESEFYDFWNRTDRIDSFGDLQRLFGDSQFSLALSQKIQSRDFLVRVDQGLQSIRVNSSHRYALTDMRRVLIKMVKSSPFLQAKQSFDLYKTLVEKELSVYPKGAEVTRELRLEIARDSLFFLNKFLEEESNIDGGQVLIQIYKDMNVDQITANLERQIFTEAETEVITFIDLLGTANLSKEAIEQVKRQQRIEAEFSVIQEEIFVFPEIEDNEKEQYPEGYIYNEEVLEEFFAEEDLNLYRFSAELNDTEEFITFDGVNYKGFTISGMFAIVPQSFETVKSGQFEATNVRKRFFDSMLRDIESFDASQEEEEEEPVETFVWGDGILQNDRLTLQSRQYVVDLMDRSKDIETIIRDVISISEDRKTLRVRRATMPKLKNEIGFTYHIEDKTVTDVIFVSGSEEIKLAQDFTLENMIDGIFEAVDLVLNPPEEEKEEDQDNIPLLPSIDS